MKRRHLALIRGMCAEAPRLGARVNVYLGVTRTGERDHYTTVRGKEDVARRATVVGYVLGFGDYDADSTIRRPASLVHLLVTVRLDEECPLVEGLLRTVHISCLECVPARKKYESL